MLLLFLPMTTTNITFQGPPSLEPSIRLQTKTFPHGPPSMEHSKGHQSWNLPLATKLWSSLTSFFPLFSKGTNLDKKEFLSFRT